MCLYVESCISQAKKKRTQPIHTCIYICLTYESDLRPRITNSKQNNEHLLQIKTDNRKFKKKYQERKERKKEREFNVRLSILMNLAPRIGYFSLVKHQNVYNKIGVRRSAYVQKFGSLLCHFIQTVRVKGNVGWLKVRLLTEMNKKN